MEIEEIVAVYEEISDITSKMLDAAKNSDWDRLTLLEAQCSSRVEILRKDEGRPVLDAGSRQTKVRLINKILADDREIRNLTEPWMQRLTAMMNSGETERRLNQAYGLNRPG
jgi:flagellar protein FliT